MDSGPKIESTDQIDEMKEVQTRRNRKLNSPWLVKEI
jgi:hypothetical protein